MSFDMLPPWGSAFGDDPIGPSVPGRSDPSPTASPVGRRGVVTAPASRSRVRVTGEGALAEEILRVLRGCGVTPSRGGAFADRRVGSTFNVLVGAMQPPRLTARAHGRRGWSHLPVDAADGGIHIGPVVVPGVTPCLHCVERHRRDADVTWSGFVPGERVAAPLVATAAAITAALVVDHLERGASASETIRVDAPVSMRRRSWTFHPGCDCASTPVVPTPRRGGSDQSSKPIAKVDSRSCRE